MSIIKDFGGKSPNIAENAYLAESATVIGNVYIGSESSIWFGCVLRGDIEAIRIGQGTNIQDGTVVHVAPGHGISVGDNVTVGHGVQLHGCTVDDEALIGMGAIVLNGAHVEKGAIVGAGALVPEGKTVPAGTVVFGVPARVARDVTDDEREYILASAEEYRRLARAYAGKDA